MLCSSNAPLRPLHLFSNDMEQRSPQDSHDAFPGDLLAELFFDGHDNLSTLSHSSSAPLVSPVAAQSQEYAGPARSSQENVQQSLRSSSGHQLSAQPSTESNTKHSGSSGGRTEKGKESQRKYRERQRREWAELNERFALLSVQAHNLCVENEYLKQRSKVLDAFLAIRDEHLRVLGTVKKPGSTSARPVQQLGVLVQEDADGQTPGQLEQLQGVTPDVFIAMWREFLAEASSWLVQGGLAGTNVQNIASICERGRFICKNVCLLNYSTMKTVLSYNLEEGREADAGDEHWQKVVRLLDLSYEQKKDIQSAYDIFLAGEAKLLPQRQKLDAWVQQNTDAQLQLTHRQILNLMDSVLVKTHGLMCTFRGYVFIKVLTPLQFAKVSVFCYPYFPDAVALRNAVGDTSELILSVTRQGCTPTL